MEAQEQTTQTKKTKTRKENKEPEETKTKETDKTKNKDKKKQKETKTHKKETRRTFALRQMPSVCLWLSPQSVQEEWELAGLPEARETQTHTHRHPAPVRFSSLASSHGRVP